jgi:hypothetical protein
VTIASPTTTTTTYDPKTAATASPHTQTTTLNSHHDTGTQDIPKVNVEHDESQDVVATSPSSLSTTTDSRAHLHQKTSITAENPQDLPQEPSDGIQETSEPTSSLDFTKNRPISPNASPSSPNLPPNEPISPKPPPNPSTTPLNTSMILKTPLETSRFTQKRPKTPVFNQNHPKPPKPLVLDENTMEFRGSTTNGTPFSPAIYCDEETARVELPFPPFHVPPHLSVATSPLPALVGYVSSAQIRSAFKNATADVVLEPTMPVITIYKPHILTAHVPTPENATTTREFIQKLPKPPEITSFLVIWHPKIIVNNVPTSGKDPPLPQSPHYNMFHSLIYIPLQIDIFICFRSVFSFC